MAGLAMTNNWMAWSFGLGIGFPVAVIVLGEIVHRLQTAHSPLAAPVNALRNLVLPIGVGVIFLQKILGYTADSSAMRLFETALWVAAIHVGLSVLNALVFRAAPGSSSWRGNVPVLLRDLLRVFLIAIGVAIVLSVVWDADLGGLLTALGVGSIVIGLALQETLGNVFSGIAVLFERPFKVGQWIKVGDHVGKVMEINWRAVRLQTRSLDQLTVPNSVIGREIIQNFDEPSDNHNEFIFIGFSYQDPPNRVRQALLDAARETPGVLASPPPQLTTTGYDDSSIGYRVRLTLDNYEDMVNVRSDFITRVWYVAKRYGLSIPFPIRTLQIERSSGLAAPSVADSLAAVQPFVGIEEDGLETLADGARIERFGAGEVVLRAGDAALGVYVVVAGEVSLRVDSAGMDRAAEFQRIGAGEFFGEGALLPTREQPFDAVATEDVEAILLQARAIHRALDRMPAMARELDEVVEARRLAGQVKQAELRPADGRFGVRAEAGADDSSQIRDGLRRFLSRTGVPTDHDGGASQQGERR